MRSTTLLLGSAFVVFVLALDGVGCNGDASTSGGGSTSSGVTTTSATSASSSGSESSSGTTVSTGGSPSTRVFVTSKTYMGNLGGVAGGDAECKSLAVAAGLGGSWKAWLGETNGMGPSSRFVHSALPYVLVGGTQIASSWTDLTDGMLAAPIDRDETGTAIDVTGVTSVWTGAGPDGTSFSPCCADWTDTASGSGAGSTKRADGGWVFGGGQGCTMLARIYCFEQ